MEKETNNHQKMIEYQYCATVLNSYPTPLHEAGTITPILKKEDN